MGFSETDIKNDHKERNMAEQEFIDYYLDPKRFLAFLVSKNETDVVGMPGSRCDCPLAKFLRSTDDFEFISVQEKQICYRNKSFNNSLSLANLPIWAIVFIKKVDRLPAKDWVRQKQAIAMLSQVRT